MSYTIKQPATQEELKNYYHLRWKRLRAPWNQAEGSETDDIEDQCFHVMASDDSGEIIGVARLQFKSDSEAQIRYMAVAKKHEREGIGREIVHFMESHAAKTGHNTIILDAREHAVGFYEKLGYKVSGKSYLLFDEIQHYSMITHLFSTDGKEL